MKRYYNCKFAFGAEPMGLVLHVIVELAPGALVGLDDEHVRGMLAAAARKQFRQATSEDGLNLTMSSATGMVRSLSVVVSWRELTVKSLREFQETQL